MTGLQTCSQKSQTLLKVVAHRHEQRQRSPQCKDVYKQIDDFRPGECSLFFDLSILHNLTNDVI